MPTTNADQRIYAVDALRGFALAGILITHMLEQFIAAPRPTSLWEDPTLFDSILQGASFLLLAGKFFSIFAFLFGVSFAIMMRNADQRGEDFSGRFIWRLSILLLFGAVHSLFYRGDILSVYAVVGLTLPFFYRLSTTWIVVIATVLFLGLGRFIFFAIFGKVSLLSYELNPDSPEIIRYVSVLQNGSFWDVIKENALHGFQPKYDFQFSVYGRGYVTLGYFLLGMTLVKIGFFDRLEQFIPQIKKALKYSSIATVASVGFMMGIFATLPKPVDNQSWGFVLGFTFYDLANISLTCVFICLFLLAYLGRFQNALNGLVPYGRMALTHYLLQTLLGTALLYGWGLGFLGKLHDWQMLLLAIGILTLQLKISKLWLKQFHYGPLEWLWRCGTYFKRIKLIKPGLNDGSKVNT